MALPISQVNAKEVTRNFTMTDADADVLARTIWGEARGEHEIGQIAIAHVVFNRIASPLPIFKQDRSIRHTCLQHDQFTCWQHHRTMRELRYGTPEYHDFLATATRSLWLWREGTDYAHAATNYVHVSRRMPAWTRHMRRVERIGPHIFFKPKEIV